jgi:dipeptidyl aminopeptidase/acylaminoacyl peptidase
MRAPELFVLLCCAGGLFAADAPLAVPGNLKADGLPAISSTVFTEMARYNESRSAPLVDWHPTRREILISTRFGDVVQLHRVAMPGGDRQQLTFFPDRLSGGRFNPADGDELVFAKDTGGGEFFQLYLLNLHSGRITLVTDGRSRNSGVHWSYDGKLIAYTSTRRNNRDSDIWIENPHEPQSARMLLQVGESGWSIDDWSHDGAQMLVEREVSAVVSELYLLDVATGQKTKLGPATADSGWFEARFAAGGKGAYLISNAAGDFNQLAYLDFASRQATPLRPEIRWDISAVEVSPDGRFVAYIANEDGYGKLHVLDSQSRAEVERLPHIDAGVITALRWRPTGHELGFSLASARTPGDTYSIDLETARLERWTYSETGGLDAAQFSEPQLIHWKSFDGRSISGFLYPAAARFTGPRPVIIDIHGGPESQFRPSYVGVRNYYLNELGVAMIFPNVRGSAGYGKTFLNLDNGVKREDSVKDIGALLDWIKTQPGLDATRIMVTGGSYGGYMTLASMTHYSARIRCAVEEVGISNFRTFLEHTEAYRRDLRRVEYGDERDPKIHDFFETISPLNNASKITKPMFIVAGLNDPRVNYTEGQQMTAALRQNNVPVWYLLADDEGHGFAKKKNRDFLNAATAEFVQKYLLGEK